MVEAQSKPRIAETSKRDADDPRDSLVVRFGADKPLKLDSGVSLAPFFSQGSVDHSGESAQHR